MMFNKPSLCGNACATNYNQRPYPNCECYKDRDYDGIPDVIDSQPDNPFDPITPEDEEFIDSDGDGWGDDAEEAWGSDPYDDNDYPYQDMDGDGYFDEEEEYYGTDPNDANDYPEMDTPPESAEPLGCYDSDGTLDFHTQAITTGYCEDAEGKHYDECVTDRWLNEWECELDKCKMYKTYCDELIGIGSVCDASADKCIGQEYTSAQCEALKYDYGKEYAVIASNQDECDEKIFIHCDLMGETSGGVDWLPSTCCLYDCIEI